MHTWKTREVKVGKVGVGGNNPIRIQSMTTSNTRDAEATAQQIICLADAGCEIARVTVQGIKEAESCEHIKNILLQKGYDIPLVADIHFYPPAAMKVVEFADKVRINPGNFIDRRASFKTIIYDDASYQAEIERLEEGFTPLVEKCKLYKRAMRIGTNHGSLSDRIMNRYGDSPSGMVESALEFARVCRKLDFHNIIFSMKASNPVVMMEAYRLLVKAMMDLGWDYPLHLGVTEAGDGQDGRIKSAIGIGSLLLDGIGDTIGIGSLLLDGIGDTIRVSLTEDPWQEIDPCQRIISYANAYRSKMNPALPEQPLLKAIEKRVVVAQAPLHRDGSVLIAPSVNQMLEPDFYSKIGLKFKTGIFEKTEKTVDAVILKEIPERISSVVETLQKAGVGILLEKDLVTVKEGYQFDDLLKIRPSFVVVDFSTLRVHGTRKFFEWVKKHNYNIPIILSFAYDCSMDDLIIHSAMDIGSLLTDGMAEGLCVRGEYDVRFLTTLSFNILQGSRLRSTKTEYISCPGCGRTLFQLQEVTQKIRERTGHLPGVKIAVMGCIVNGPGEMADADFGYVGSKTGKVDLYIGKTCVEKDIDFSNAEEKLIELIKKHGRWKEKEAHEAVTVEA